MRVGLIAAGGFTYLGGLGALIITRDSVLNPPSWLHGTPGDVPTTGMLGLFAFVVVPGVAILFLGMALKANQQYKRIDTLLAIVGLAVSLVLLMGSAVVII